MNPQDMTLFGYAVYTAIISEAEVHWKCPCERPGHYTPVTPALGGGAEGQEFRISFDYLNVELAGLCESPDTERSYEVTS